MPTIPPSDLPIRPFSSASEFEAFLEQEHAASPGIYLKLAKKSSGIPSISFEEATEVALCFGWINGQGKPFDDQWHLSRFTARRPQSLWSKKNVETVARLGETGRMRPAGIAAVEAAKADGRWDRAYAGPSTMTVPDDFASALAKDAAATSAFKGLNKTGSYNILLRIYTAPPSARAKRVNALVKTLADGSSSGKSDPPVIPRKKSTRGQKGRSTLSNSAKRRRRVGSPHSEKVNQAKLPRRAGLRPRS